VGSGQWAVGSGQWAVGSGQWAVGSGQWAVGSLKLTGNVVYRLLVTDHWPLITILLTAHCPLPTAHFT